MILIVDCGTSWLRHIKRNVKLAGASYTIVKVDELDGIDFTPYNGIIISGAPILLTESDIPRYLTLFTFIKTTKLPVFGICLGHQIMGLLYGSEIHKGKMVNKNENIKIVQKDPFLIDISDKSLFREEHSEYINLPKEFQLLASSDSCGNEIMKHKRKMLYGTQFHPEVSGKAGEVLFKIFLRMCN